MEQYPKSDGALWPNDQKTLEKHPDYRGKIVVTPDQIRYLIAMGKAGIEPTIQLAMWSRTSKAGQPYLFLSTETYMKEQQPGQPQQPAPTQWGAQPVAPAPVAPAPVAAPVAPAPVAPAPVAPPTFAPAPAQPPAAPEFEPAQPVADDWEDQVPF